MWTKLLLVCILLTGCGTYEITEHQAFTPEERECARTTAVKLMGNVPSTLAGHDQDWDDAMYASYKTALGMCTPPRLIEREHFTNRPTGRWRYYDGGK